MSADFQWPVLSISEASSLGDQHGISKGEYNLVAIWVIHGKWSIYFRKATDAPIEDWKHRIRTLMHQWLERSLWISLEDTDWMMRWHLWKFLALNLGLSNIPKRKSKLNQEKWWKIQVLASFQSLDNLWHELTSDCEIRESRNPLENRKTPDLTWHLFHYDSRNEWAGRIHCSTGKHLNWF